MALLTSCWFIIESVIIPDGFRKWFYLSFFIHPLLLVLCQIFLWVKLLKRWILAIVFLPSRIICFVGLCLLNFLRNCVCFFSFSRSTNDEVLEEVEKFEIPQNCNRNQIVDSYTCSSVTPIRYELKILEFRTNGFEEDSDYKEDSAFHVDETMEVPNFHVDDDISMSDEYLSSVCSSNSPIKDVNLNEYISFVCGSNSPTEDLGMNEYLPSVFSSNTPVMEREVTDDEQYEEESDPFFEKYSETMRWFDVLNYDRTCGISAILNKQLGTPSSFESIESVDFSIPYISWSKMARKRLLRSLESDFEMVYVAQSCLSWEALHHQYRKVEALACSSSQNGVFYDNVAGKFQKFQVLLERFMEDERCEGKRFWNYVRRRFSLKSLLQVPEVSGYLEEEKEGMKGEGMRAGEALKDIEKCIKTFWVFVKTDNKKSWWKFRTFLWTYPPVEDPKDLELLADLTKSLQKKELWMKDLHGKKRCWLKRLTNPHEESQMKEILFTMIDMHLVSRVLKMSMISSSQLKWCEEKLNNIEFKEGKIIRACTGLLFPSS